MKFCIYCMDRIWPWQSYGHRVLADGSQLWWHGRCAR